MYLYDQAPPNYAPPHHRLAYNKSLPDRAPPNQVLYPAVAEYSVEGPQSLSDLALLRMLYQLLRLLQLAAKCFAEP